MKIEEKRGIMTAFQLDHLCFSYNGQRILNNLTGRIPKGSFLCLAGPSGIGKTTLLRLLAGLEQPDSGSLTLFGKPVVGPGRDRAVVFQQDPLFPWMNVEKNVVFAIKCTQVVDKKTARLRAKTLLQQVGLAGEEKKYPCQLSGGMKQRAALARALALHSEILLLDEPFGALDPGTRQNMEQLLQNLWIKNRMTVVMVTHDLQEAVTLADRIWILRDGRLEADLPMDLPRSEREIETIKQELQIRFFGNTEEQS